MSELFFANDAPVAAQTNALLERFVGDWRQDQDEVSGWLLVDAALVDHDRFAGCIRRWHGQVHNALAASSMAAFGEHAPYFLACSRDIDELKQQVRQLHQIVGDATAVSWLQCDGTVSDLQALAAYLAKVWIHERKAPVHCRFADTRVLPELLETLDTDQIALVQSVVRRWYWNGRQGDPCNWGVSDAATHGTGFPADRTLRLSVGQFRAMQDAAEADGIFLMLCRKTPELVPDTGRGALHATLCDLLQQADALNVSTTEDRLQFAVLGLSSGEDFHEMPALQPTWRAMSSSQIGLLGAMQDWDDRVWAELDRRRHALAGVGM